MVCINTYKSQDELEFKHFVGIRSSNCYIATAREKVTNRTKLYLLFIESDRIYTRNGLKGAWTLINDPDNYSRIRYSLYDALADKSIPKYSTHELSGLVN